MITFILYSRPGCHLCELLTEELEPLVRGRAQIRHVDVSQDVDLEQRYGLRIPVLVTDGMELSGYPLDRDRVGRYLASL
ncbi:MAG TPA: glutaredoxin family protein [Gammaproteobacteria bacterium]|nr:glutaredoxin family protein [Gammaproteobacteria bacterium]